MRVVNHPFFVELQPESLHELNVARSLFDASGTDRSFLVPAVTDSERRAVIARFHAAADLETSKK